MTQAVTTDEATPLGPLDRLRALHQGGRIADAYSEIGPLLNELCVPKADFAALARAGRLLARTAPDQIVQRHPQATPLRVAVTGHGMLDALSPALTAQFARHGIPVRIDEPEYDAWLRDLQDPASPLYEPETALALCVLDAQIVFDELPLPWTATDAVAALEARLKQLTALVARYGEHGPGTLVLNTLPLLATHTRQLLDHASRAELSASWREFNAGLLRLAAAHPRLHVVDLDVLVAESGPVRDPRLACYAKVHLGEELLGRYAQEVAHLGRALHGRAKKVLVVDLDNTLWDGILGDDGPDGIAAATTYRGEAFGRFQKIVKQIGAQGVLLAVSSKNDKELVLSTLRDHPDMVLRESNFARINANWEPKHGNLRDIAARLNLGVDSFVFADDSPFECGLVNVSLPEVAVVQLDDEPALHVDRLLADGWFDVRSLTAEDRLRAQQYRAEAERQDLEAASGSMEEYLRALNIRLEISAVRDHEVARIAQITLRTNQFNLTTLRLQQAEVQQRREDPNHLVLAVRTRDRFGDNGVVGAVFAHREGDVLHVDNMLLSCRVFARGIEQATLSSVLAYARDTGATAVRARYRPTAKNHRVRDFYPSLGFTASTEGPDGELAFTHDLTSITPVPGHLALDTDLGD
ncbi:HAD-IIIC family phosphatase [Streptomyces cyslabdanicus]|uniref:HAD-IIIC family phosphatase n=1 Tax=Streptomyces cyslabdanicus TaxID=1470456 RepID=UPI004044F437